MVALGAVGLVLLIGIASLIFAGGDDDDDEEGQDTTPLAAAPRLGGTVEHGIIGATIRKPDRWTHRRGGRSMTLRSPDGTVVMAISLPSGTDRSAAVLETGLGAVRMQYRNVQPIATLRQRVAELPTNSVVTRATNSRGVKLRILTSAPQGRTRAWLVQVFSAERAKERRLAEAQVAISTLRLTG